jgi:hypothetical protein
MSYAPSVFVNGGYIDVKMGIVYEYQLGYYDGSNFYSGPCTRKCTIDSYVSYESREAARILMNSLARIVTRPPKSARGVLSDSCEPT